MHHVREPRPTRRALARARAVSGAVAVALLAGACSAAGGADDAGTDGEADDPVISASGTVVDAATAVEEIEGGAVAIDVRTPEEVAEGAVEGAVLADVSDPGFEQAIADLDRSERYVVYCRTGNRSAQAIQRMLDLGFEDLLDGGAFVDLEAAGAPVA